MARPAQTVGGCGVSLKSSAQCFVRRGISVTVMSTTGEESACQTGRRTMSKRAGNFRSRTLVAAGAAAAVCLPIMAAPAGADPGDVTFTEMFDFEEYSTGVLDGQDGWSATEAAQVIPDPLNGNNQIGRAHV